MIDFTPTAGEKEKRSKINIISKPGTLFKSVFVIGKVCPLKARAREAAYDKALSTFAR